MSAILDGILGNAAYDLLKRGFANAPTLRSNVGEFRLVFNLVSNFYEMPPFDNAERILTEILQNYTESAGVLNHDKCRFHYQVNFDEYEGCTAPEYLWLADVIADEKELNKFFNEEEYLAARCVSGFVLRLLPISSEVDIRDVLVEGYDLLNLISNDLRRDFVLKIRNTVCIANIIASKETTIKIRTRFEKLLNKKNTEVTVRLEDIFDNQSLLTIYLKDKLEVSHLVEAIKSWWII